MRCRGGLGGNDRSWGRPLDADLRRGPEADGRCRGRGRVDGDGADRGRFCGAFDGGGGTGKRGGRQKFVKRTGGEKNCVKRTV